ncbi:DUF58 domain-containing protein [Paraburkholderia unamae]|uniref:DUF58 domain-containing protein n=1 Tax=Paraburkholderia unamae TaxID=219649 RepID=A0ABX5KHC2_9BURK|nr:MxaS protein [Paraburkholderia unamae]PVX77033.1 hypothetical protein C7402_11592 [Paraburkholderia unamae]RAR52825.1 hypothetical protein C7401_13017 [Paraburkholderia unamae]CAG9260490.1 Putative MxaS-like protein [Paraburkholderia unamae]
MNATAPFHYRFALRASGHRPGSHPGTSVGAGDTFALHGRLFDHPDPRRLDLRASVRAARSEWLVRLHLQRSAVPVQALVDVSASMRFGARRTKLQVAADFVEALGYSAFRAGDPLGMLAFDHDKRDDLFMPARTGRGVGNVYATMLREHADTADLAGAPGHGATIAGLQRVASRLAGRQALVFLVSDFHWPLSGMALVLDLLVNAYVVPVVVWDRAEITPPEAGRLLAVRDAEAARHRTLWLRRGVRERWLEAVAQRRTDLARAFAPRGIRPFYLHDEFDPEAMSRYFLEAAA